MLFCACACGGFLVKVGIVKQPYTKTSTSIAQQIAKIEQRDLVITDRSKAEKYLRNIGYYRLSGYWFPFRKSQIVKTDSKEYLEVLDNFRDGVDFAHIVDLYVFDKQLRLIMMDVLERIEISLRTAVVLHMGKKGRFAHRQKQFFDGKFTVPRKERRGRSKFDDFIDIIDGKHSNSKEDFIKHFNRKYTGDVPLWISAELWDFGNLSMFIAGLKFKDQRAIAAQYGIDRPQLLPSWIRTLAFIRNVCAHHGRLWNKPLIAEPIAPKVGEFSQLDHMAGTDNKFYREQFYAAAVIARYFQLQINPTSSWGERFVSVIQSFPDAPYIALKQAGFPDKWEDLDIWST